MKMRKREYRIGELAKQLNVEKFVIRFWEKELDIKPNRSRGGQRFYQEKDLQTFLTVKTLLYEKKFTLAGAKKELTSQKNKKVIYSTKTNKPTTVDTDQEAELKKKLFQLQKKLTKLQALL